MEIKDLQSASQDQPRGEPARPSKVDSFSGRHTNSLIVAGLFLATLAGLIVLVVFKDKLPENLITGLVGILGVLAGFFAATLK